jgi:hypothetical protein
MRSTGVRVIAALLVMLLLFPVQAQDEPFIQPELCSALPDQNARAACIFLNECAYGFRYSVGSLPRGCVPYVTHLVLDGCTQPVCGVDTLLSLGAILTTTQTRLDGFSYSNVSNSLTDAFRLYAMDRPADGAATLMNLYEEEYPDRHVAYSAALLFQQAGLIEEALDAFSVSIGTEFYTALPFYSRGQLRAELGDAIGAAQDFYTFFEVRARSELTAFEALSVPRVTLDDLMPESERMIQYELMRSSYSPGGEYVSYQFGRPGHAVEISKSEDGHIISALEVMYSRNYPRLLFFECLDGVCQRSLAYQNTSGFLSGYGDDRTTLTINDEYIEVYKEFFGFESGSDELAILVPEAQPDPRPSVPCEDGAFPLFQIGDGITTTLKVWPVFDVRVAPDVNSAVVPEDSEGRNGYLQIAGDLTCGPGGNWWPVAVDGEMVGWIGDTEGWEFYSTVPSRWYPLRTVAELLALQWPGTRSAAVASPGTPSATVAPTATLSVQVSTLAHTPTVSGIETSTQSAPARACLKTHLASLRSSRRAIAI